jgi:hypothetical protein
MQLGIYGFSLSLLGRSSISYLLHSAFCFWLGIEYKLGPSFQSTLLLDVFNRIEVYIDGYFSTCFFLAWIFQTKWLCYLAKKR